MVHMDKLGRKFFLVLSMVLSGSCVFLIYLVKSATSNLIISCCFGLVSTMGFNALDCLGIELFPTNVRYIWEHLRKWIGELVDDFHLYINHSRSTAMAVTLAVARLGAILSLFIFGYFIEVSCSIPILLVASLLVSGNIFSELNNYVPNL